jgi:hypothetical protein
MSVLGSMLLWAGWYGFNTTGAVHVGDEVWGSIVGRVGINTTLAPVSAAAVVCIVSWYHKRFINVSATVSHREIERHRESVCVRVWERKMCACESLCMCVCVW